MFILKKVFLKITLFLTILIVFCFCLFSYQNGGPKWPKYEHSNETVEVKTPLKQPLKYKQLNIWCIFTKVEKNSALQYKFSGLVKSLLEHTSNVLHFHVICDDFSRTMAENIFKIETNSSKIQVFHSFYDVEECARIISDIVTVMTPHFSSRPGTYYSDALFYLSLGLHRIAPIDQDEAIMLDCDIKFTKDVSLLYQQFVNFKGTTLFGLAPELNPVYLHVLYTYREKINKNTTFGDYLHESPIAKTGNHVRGFQGYNSGVMLFNLKAIRESTRYNYLISKKNVERLVDKYKFGGHLGDQDYYTLLGYEYPELFHTLPCRFNRQLCKWWRDHGYKDIFDKYFKCDEDIVVYHGNCNSPFPL